MRKLLSLICCFTFLILLNGCNETGGNNIKIGVVDLNKVMKECDMGKAGLKLIEEQQTKMQADLDALNEKLEKNPSDEDLIRQLQTLYASSQQKMQAEAENIVTQIFDTIQNIISNYRKKNDFDLLIRLEALDAYAPALDVTNEILKEVNQIKIEFKPLAATPAVSGGENKTSQPEKTEKNTQ